MMGVASADNWGLLHPGGHTQGALSKRNCCAANGTTAVKAYGMCGEMHETACFLALRRAGEVISSVQPSATWFGATSSLPVAP
jgi:hypothetical protein